MKSNHEAYLKITHVQVKHLYTCVCTIIKIYLYTHISSEGYAYTYYIYVYINAYIYVCNIVYNSFFYFGFVKKLIFFLKKY